MPKYETSSERIISVARLSRVGGERTAVAPREAGGGGGGSGSGGGGGGGALALAATAEGFLEPFPKKVLRKLAETRPRL